MEHGYDLLWRSLNQLHLVPPSQDHTADDSEQAFIAAQSYFSAGERAKVVDLSSMSREDKSYLASLKISSEELLRNFDKTIHSKFRDARAFQLNALKKHAIYAFCPFSGQRVESRHSLLANINTIFYRFATQEVFYLAIAGIGQGFQKCALYFPEHELIVTVGSEWSFHEADLIELKSRVVANAQLCYEYLADGRTEQPQTAVCIGFYHFAHHLWNELSGVHRLFQKGLINEVGAFLVTREPLGKLEQIYPEIAENKVQRRATTGELFVEILEKRYLALKVGGDFISSELADRVFKVAAAACSSETWRDVNSFVASHSPVLWIGIRVGNRSWADQTSGLATLIASLLTDFPKLGVIFDGFSLPGDRPASTEDADFAGIVRQENEVAEAIIKQLRFTANGLGIVNIIGKSIFDANIWAHHTGFYLSPYGTLQHKVGWLTNKPGIIHSNQTLLKDPAKYVWSAVEGAIPPRYLNPEAVSDISNSEEEFFAYNSIGDARESGAGVLALNKTVQSAPQFNNYHVDWRTVYRDLVQLINHPGYVSGVQKTVFVNTAKRKLREGLQSISNAIDFSGV